MPDTSQFRVGDSVVVNPGVMDPDKTDISLAGWQGRVTELYPDAGTLFIQWDSQTLRAIPDDYIRECELGGLGWESMVLDMTEVSPAAPRDKPRDVEAAYEEIGAHHRWDHLADTNPGISALLGPLGKLSEMGYLHAWETHLKQALRFPFEASVEEMIRRGPVEVGDIVQVLGISDVHDRYGIFVDAKLDGRVYTLPLCDMEATDDSSPNYQPLNDYVVWFANR